MEEMIKLFKTILKVDLPATFQRLPYAEAMSRYGSDKPDLRIPMELIDIGDLLAKVEFKILLILQTIRTVELPPCMCRVALQ